MSRDAPAVSSERRCLVLRVEVLPTLTGSGVLVPVCVDPVGTLKTEVRV